MVRPCELDAGRINSTAAAWIQSQLVPSLNSPGAAACTVVRSAPRSDFHHFIGLLTLEQVSLRFEPIFDSSLVSRSNLHVNHNTQYCISSNIMCPSQLFSFFFVFLLLPFFINFSGANTNTPFAYCPSSICHGRNISYPFWSLDNFNSTSPQYCGYPGFGIHCSQNNPILNISNDSFFVKDIDYNTFSLTLVDIDALDTRDCPRAHHNVTLGDLPLKYSKLDMNLTFYFNCIDSLSSGRSLDCLNSGRNKSYLYIEGNEPDDLNWYEICEKKVVAAVMDSERIRRSIDAAIGAELTRGLGTAMDEGFVLDGGSQRSAVSVGHQMGVVVTTIQHTSPCAIAKMAP